MDALDYQDLSNISELHKHQDFIVWAYFVNAKTLFQTNLYMTQNF